MDSKFPIVLVYDMKLKRPGCALLQAVHGGSLSSFELQKFGVDNWLLAPTENLKPYKINSQEELDAAIKITQENSKK